MKLDGNARPWWSLHTLSWMWLSGILLASLTINVVVRNENGDGRIQYGWPFAFAEEQIEPFDIDMDLSLAPPGFVFLPTDSKLRVAVSLLVLNCVVCAIISLLSVWTIERWFRSIRLPRNRITVRSLLILVTWASCSYVFFRVFSWELQDVVSSFDLILSMRFYDWSLLIMFFAFGVALFGLADLSGIASRRMLNHEIVEKG